MSNIAILQHVSNELRKVHYVESSLLSRHKGEKIVTKQFLAVLAFWGQCLCLHMTSYIYSTLLKYFIEELSPAEHKQKDAGSERDVAGQQAFDVI